MCKIPTVFERDWEGERSRVVDKVHLGCEWVLAGEGIATRKLDGTSCMIRGRNFYKRREVRRDQIVPPDFKEVERDDITGKTVGWVPVGQGPEDRQHQEAFLHVLQCRQNWATHDNFVPDGTYELVGPGIQGNPERYPFRTLVPHSDSTLILEGVPRTFDGLKEWLAIQDIEGVVFHHPDGRMAKIKLRDFGIKRGMR